MERSVCWVEGCQMPASCSVAGTGCCVTHVVETVALSALIYGGSEQAAPVIVAYATSAKKQ